MLIRQWEAVPISSKRMRLHTLFQCDHTPCVEKFVVIGRTKLHRAGANHYHSKQCSRDAKRKGGTAHRKLIATCEARYGVQNPYQIPYVFERGNTDEAWEKRFASAIETNMERYGVASPLQLPSIREAAHSPEAWEKRTATAKKNGTFKSSFGERKLAELLIQHFGQDDVNVQVHPPTGDKRHTIDFFVVPLQTYIQVDGVYWHGHDRPLEVIREGTTERDKVIYRKWLWDNELDEYCRVNAVKLVRVLTEDVEAPDFSFQAFLNRLL